MGRPPIGKIAMTDAERHKRYMARLRARAAAGGNNVTHDEPVLPEPGIQLDWGILVDDTDDGYLSVYTEPYGLYVRQLGDTFYWYVLKDDDDSDKDAIEVAEGDASSLVAAMTAAEAAARNRT
jgi:hypothetical protein